MKIEWKYIALFILTALGLSFPIQQGYVDSFFQSIAKDTFLFGSSYLLAGISTLVAALAAFAFHKDVSNKITILGATKGKNVLILILPVAAFSTVGLKNSFGINESLFGFAFAAVNTLYAFAEEFGWRKYLQNALEGFNRNAKYLLIAAVWWVWHFRFATQFDLFIFPLICLGGGFLLGKLADDLGSILLVVTMHNLIILTTNSGGIDQHKIAGIVLVILGWIAIEQIWKRRSRKSQKH